MQANSIAQAVLFSCLLIVASVWDIRKRIIPDSICLAIAVVGLLTFHPTKLIGALISLPFLIAALAKDGGMGGGDIKLMTTCGFALGLLAACVGTIIGLSVLLLWHIIMQAVFRVKGIPMPLAVHTAMPLAPFLSVGFIGAMLLKLGSHL